MILDVKFPFREWSTIPIVMRPLFLNNMVVPLTIWINKIVFVGIVINKEGEHVATAVIQRVIYVSHVRWNLARRWPVAIQTGSMNCA